MSNGKSDPCVVLRVWESHAHGEGAGQSITVLRGYDPYQTRIGTLHTKLERIAEAAKRDPSCRFFSLMRHITVEFLKETLKLMKRSGASGVDGISLQLYEQDLEVKLLNLVDRVRTNTYFPPAVKRVEIPKGEGKTRPLGIPTVEDRLLQTAVRRLMDAVYEQDFLEESHGFRAGHSCHGAIKVLREHIVARKVSYVYDVDIRGYFDNIHHKHLLRFVSQRIADKKLMLLIGRWLRAGVMVNGVVVQTEKGTPQGGPISPILANIYLHFVLDLWFREKVKPKCQGEVYLVRYADDFVVCFQNKVDADKFKVALALRLEEYGLSISEEKSQLIAFGRFARGNALQKGEVPKKFNFLGFTHVCGVSHKTGKFAVVRLPSRKSCRKFLDGVKSWLVKCMHIDCRKQQQGLTSRLRGFYQYFGLYHCSKKLYWVRREVERIWYHMLKRRSQKPRVYLINLWKQDWFELPRPELTHNSI